MKKILVTGATGNLGSAVAMALSAKGLPVRAASRHPEKTVNTATVEPFFLDYEKSDSHDAALSGIEGLFLVAPPLDPEAPAKLIPLIDRAKALGIGHIVLNSAFGVDAVETAPLRVIERHLMASNVPYTILRPNFFMQNFSSGFIAPMIKQHQAILLAADDAKTSFISTEDIAAVALSSFAEKRSGREFNLTGPEALDHFQAATIISEAADRKVSYQPVSEEEMLQGGRDIGMPESAVQYMAVLFQAVRAGFMARLTDDVVSVTGHAPTSFRNFAEQNRQAWR